MTIEAGVLALRIQEQGADAVLAKLNQIDAKAKALGTAVQNVKFNAPSATGVSGQLQQISADFTKVGQAANQATPAVDKHTDATNRNARATKTAADMLGSQILGYYSLNNVVNTALKIFDEFNAAADRQAVAQMRLKASAQLSGTTLGTVTAIANEAQKTFKLSTADAADLTQVFVRLASGAGNVGKSGAVMTAWMDLAAAQGIPLTRIVEGVNSALSGNDDALNRLGIMDPSAIYRKWADAVGAHNGQLTQQQKLLAIVNEVMEQGAKARGAYSEFLDTIPGKQQAWNSSLEQFNAHIGAAGGGVRGLAYDIGTTLVNAFVGADDAIDRIAAKTSSWFRALIGMGPSPLAEKLRGIDPLSEDPGLAAATKAGNAAIEQQKAEAKARAEEAKKEAERLRKEAERKRREELEKAMGADLGGMGVAGLTPTVDEAARIARTTPTVGVGKDGKMKGVKAFGLADVVDKEFDTLEKKLKERTDKLRPFVESIAQTVGGAFGDAFSAAFQGGNFFAEFGKSLIAGLGNIVMQLGEQLLAYGLIISPLASLLTFTPFGGLGLGAGASIAAGVALTALGAAMGAAGGKGGKGGGAGGGRGSSSGTHDDNTFAVAFDPDHKRRRGPAVVPSSRSITNAAMPDARPGVYIGTLNALHPDDPRWQREIATTVKNATDRGLLKKAG